MDFKKTVGENLSKLRKSRKLTQLELAEMFSYSDKAVSKWEKGETLPDAETLHKLASFYGVTLDYLVHEHEEDDLPGFKNTPANKLATTLLIICFIWLLGAICYIWLRQSVGTWYYQCFIWPIPASFLAIMVANIKWGNRNYTFYFASLFLWTLILAVFLQFKDYGDADLGVSLSLFILGIPIQVMIAIWSFVRGNPFSAAKQDLKKLRDWHKQRRVMRKAAKKEKKAINKAESQDRSQN